MGHTDSEKERARSRRARARRDSYSPSERTWARFLGKLPDWLREHVEVLRRRGIPWREIKPFADAAVRFTRRQQRIIEGITEADIEPYHRYTEEQIERLSREEWQVFHATYKKLKQLIERAREVGLSPHPLVRRWPLPKEGRPISEVDRKTLDLIRDRRKQGKQWESIRRSHDLRDRPWARTPQAFHQFVTRYGLR